MSQLKRKNLVGCEALCDGGGVEVGAAGVDVVEVGVIVVVVVVADDESNLLRLVVVALIVVVVA